MSDADARAWLFDQAARLTRPAAIIVSEEKGQLPSSE